MKLFLESRATSLEIRVRVRVSAKVSLKKRLMPKLRPGALDATNHAFKP